jgi:hypothetical protein
MEYIEYKSYCPYLAGLHGKKPSKTDRLIMLRSGLVHTEIKFPPRHGGISASATKRDDCDCFRFKMIGYSHPERWLTVRIPCTEAQVDAIFAKCCEMADMPCFDYSLGDFTALLKSGQCAYGPNALKYDLIGLLSFTSKLRLIRPHTTKVWCTEACFIALLEAFPSLLQFDLWHELQPHDLHPSHGDMIIRNYVRSLSRI